MPSPILTHFKYKHLRPDLQEISAPLCEVAFSMDAKIPDGAEKSAGLRKLLEAKDCLVRAYLEGQDIKVLPRVLTMEDAHSFLELAHAEEDRLYRELCRLNPSYGPRGARGERGYSNLAEYVEAIRTVEKTIESHRAEIAEYTRTPDERDRSLSDAIYASVKRMGLENPQ